MEAEDAFQQLNLHLQSLHALTVPIPGEMLTLYLAASHKAVSSVLLTDREHVQKPIYFVNKALQGPELNYPMLEKLALALVHTARRQRRYFQAHEICVLTDQPIRQVLLKPVNSGRLAKWVIELGEQDITYKPRSAIKGQILADFLAEAPKRNVVTEIKTTLPSQHDDKLSSWTLYTDGACGNEGSRVGLFLTDHDEKEVTYALSFDFPTSNNETEYEALIAGLELAIRLEFESLQTYTDSLLIINQVKGINEAREDSMKWYLAKVKHLQSKFKTFSCNTVVFKS